MSVVVLPDSVSKVVIIKEQSLIAIKPIVHQCCLLSCHLVFIVIHVIHAFITHWILLLIFLHDLQVDLVVHLESPVLNLLLPDFIMDLNEVKDCIDQHSDVRVLITQQLQYNGDHLGLMQDYLASRLEEEELKERVEYLLHHLIVFLLRSQQVLEHFNQI
jgi:hypothetical protein